MSWIAKACILAFTLPLLFLTACGNGGSGGASSFQLETVDVPSDAKPAHTPGSPGVTVTNPRLIAQFGSADFDLNNARYTRYYLSGQADSQPVRLSRQALTAFSPNRSAKRDCFKWRSA